MRKVFLGVETDNNDPYLGVHAILLDTLTLSDKFLWLNEFDWSPVAQESERTLTGALMVSE